MRYGFAACALVTAIIITGAAGQACAAGSAQEINGNWYCQAVKAITYTGFGTTGSYKKVTNMASGVCGSTPFTYGGTTSPMDEEVSWHFRGPLHLKQFAYYTPGTTSSKRAVKAGPKARRHGHQGAHHVHQDGRDVQENRGIEERRAAGDIVVATIDGAVVSWTNQYTGPGTPATVAAASAPAVPATSAAAAGESSAPPMNAGSGIWGRQAYYNADGQYAGGLVFLNHNGGQGSGVFDDIWGNSLSYASAGGTSGSASPETLANQAIADNVEVVIMSDAPCSNGDCGTVRPGTVAYHGFEGASKLFVLEFSMPISGKTGFNADMPAAWMLNAQIPNTVQYGAADCSCWASGCGELDVFEILDSGNTRARSTWHGNISGGDSNYFNRPTGATVKVAVILDGANGAAHIIVLPDSTDFSATLSEGTVNDFINKVAIGEANANFALGS